MTNKSNIGPYTTRILKKMCRMVGADFKSIDFKNDHFWFTRYSWTLEEQDIFKTWLTNFLTKNKLAQLELTGKTLPSTSRIKEVADHFIFMYGWTLTYEK